MIDRRATSMAAALALAGIALALPGCARIRDHKGYVVDSGLIDTVQPGVDNRDSVAKTLGRPSLASEFDGGATWYYVSRETRQFAFTNPKPIEQTLLAVRYNQAGDVVAVQKTGLETIRKVSPWGRQTPTLGRKYNFLRELFGNVGAGGPNAARAPSSDNPGG